MLLHPKLKMRFLWQYIVKNLVSIKVALHLLLQSNFSLRLCSFVESRNKYFRIERKALWSGCEISFLQDCPHHVIGIFRNYFLLHTFCRKETKAYPHVWIEVDFLCWSLWIKIIQMVLKHALDDPCFFLILDAQVWKIYMIKNENLKRGKTLGWRVTFQL